jgi:hypothetical protein
VASDFMKLPGWGMDGVRRERWLADWLWQIRWEMGRKSWSKSVRK